MSVAYFMVPTARKADNSSLIALIVDCWWTAKIINDDTTPNNAAIMIRSNEIFVINLIAKPVIEVGCNAAFFLLVSSIADCCSAKFDAFVSEPILFSEPKDRNRYLPPDSGSFL